MSERSSSVKSKDAALYEEYKELHKEMMILRIAKTMNKVTRDCTKIRQIGFE